MKDNASSIFHSNSFQVVYKSVIYLDDTCVSNTHQSLFCGMVISFAPS